MKAAVNKEGVLIPKEMLGDAKEVEIQQENGCIVVLPIPAPDDPIFELGKLPVECGVQDGAVEHDKYLYDNK